MYTVYTHLQWYILTIWELAGASCYWTWGTLPWSSLESLGAGDLWMAGFWGIWAKTHGIYWKITLGMSHTHIYICIKWIYRIYGIYKQMWIMSKKSRTIVISQIGTGMWTPETMHKLTDLISSERWWPLATPLSFTVGKVTVGVSHLCTKVIYIYSHMHKHVDVDVILHIHL